MSRPSRRTTVASRDALQAQDTDPALKFFWEGRFSEAQRKYETKMAKGNHTNPIAAVRYAEITFIMALMTGDKSVPPECVERFQFAAGKCQAASDVLQEQLLPELERHAKEQPLMRRLSRRASTSAPWTAKLGISTKHNPGELKPSEVEFQVDKNRLKEWKQLQGLVALCELLRGVSLFLIHGYMKGGFCVKKAWSIVKNATANPEAEKDAPCSLDLVKGALQLLLANVPPFMLTFLKAIGFKSDEKKGMQRLEHCLRADPSNETHNFARLLLALHFVLVSQQEYRADRLDSLKKAESLIQEGMDRETGRGKAKTHGKDWVLFQWMRSHIQRRMGHVADATEELGQLSAIVRRESMFLKTSETASRPGIDATIQSYRLDFDHGLLLFMQGYYAKAMEIINPLVTPPSSQFSGRVLGCTVLSACAAMLGDDVIAVQWLEFIDSLEDKGKMDRSIHVWKLDTLLRRPHKRLLAYEILYIYSQMKFFDGRVSGVTNTEHANWLKRSYKDLNAIHEAATVSVVYPEFPATPISATEELLTSSLLCGAVAALMGELDQAEKHLRAVLDNKDNITSKHGDDPFMAPFALYELASISIRRRNWMEARAHLARAEKKCRKKNFSFYHMLAYKCMGAARYINEKLGVTVEDPMEHLASFLGPDEGFATSPQSAAGGGDGDGAAAEGEGEGDGDGDGAATSSGKNRRKSLSLKGGKSKRKSFASSSKKDGASAATGANGSAATGALHAAPVGTQEVEGKKITHHDGLAEYQMKAVKIASGSTVSVPRHMKPFETASWQITIEQYDLDIKVEFFGSKSAESSEALVVYETERHEEGDFIEGFYTSQGPGTLIVTFDNRFSLFTEKTVHYMLT